MFKKLEEDKNVNMAAEDTPEEECRCSCKAEEQDSKESVPEASYSITYLAVHYDING